MAASPVFVGNYNCEFVAFANADSTTAKTIFTPGANGSRIEAIVGTSNDSAARYLMFGVVVGAVTYFLWRSTLPIGSVNWQSIDCLGDCPAAARMDGGLILENGQILVAWMEVALTSGKEATIGVFGGDL